MSNKDILVVGFPKSGNTWLARLLGDILNCPVRGWGSAHPLAEEGLERNGKYIVRQLHLHPVETITVPNYDAWGYSLKSTQGERIVLVQRNPLDVIVSAYYYWEIESIDIAIEAVLTGRTPLEAVGPWEVFYEQWRQAFIAHPYIPHAYAYYEELLSSSATGHIESILQAIGTDYDKNRIAPAMHRQSFDMRKNELVSSGSKYNYGATIQSKNLRGGRSGDWRSEMRPHQVGKVKSMLSKGTVRLYDL